MRCWPETNAGAAPNRGEDLAKPVVAFSKLFYLMVAGVVASHAEKPIGSSARESANARLVG
jgi:hypothetical protein